MLEIFGKGYVIQHCISFFRKENLDKAYQIYVTELLTGIAKANGLKVDRTYRDIVCPVEVKEDAETIISRIKNKLGGGENT